MERRHEVRLWIHDPTALKLSAIKGFGDWGLSFLHCELFWYFRLHFEYIWASGAKPLKQNVSCYGFLLQPSVPFLNCWTMFESFQLIQFNFQKRTIIRIKIVLVIHVTCQWIWGRFPAHKKPKQIRNRLFLHTYAQQILKGLIFVS